MTTSMPARACRLAIALLAVSAAANVPAAVAKMPHVLTLRTAAGPLAPGAVLAGAGGTLSIVSPDKGAIECASAEPHGSLEANGASTDAFGMTIATGSFACASEWPGGAVAEVQLPGGQRATLSSKGKGTITAAPGEAPLRVDVNFPGSPSCDYTAAKITFRVATGTVGHPQPVVLDVKRELKPVNPLPKGCAMMLSLTATLPLFAERPPALSGEYETVESEAS